jgi:hypothetical protein
MDLQLSCGDLPKLYGASVASLGSLQLSCGDCPKLCTGFGDRPQVSHSDRVFHLGGRAQGDYGETPWRLGSPVPPHRSNGDKHPQGCELRDTSLSPRASVISIPELLYIFNLLCDSHRA